MKYFQPLIMLALLFLTGFGVHQYDVQTSLPRFYGSVSDADAKHAVMAQYIWSQARLKQTPTIDLALGTTLEWTDAYVKAAQDNGATIPLTQTVGTLNTALQTRAGALSKLCNNPNFVSISPKDINVAIPQ